MVGCDRALKPDLGLFMVARLVTYLGEGVLRVEANRWELLGLSFDSQQERFGAWEIAALREQLCFKKIAELYIERLFPSLGKISGFVDVLLRRFWVAVMCRRSDASAWST